MKGRTDIGQGMDRDERKGIRSASEEKVLRGHGGLGMGPCGVRMRREASISK